MIAERFKDHTPDNSTIKGFSDSRAEMASPTARAPTHFSLPTKNNVQHAIHQTIHKKWQKKCIMNFQVMSLSATVETFAYIWLELFADEGLSVDKLEVLYDLNSEL